MAKLTTIRSRALTIAVACTGILTGCAATPGEGEEDDLGMGMRVAGQDLTAVGDPLPGITADDFATVKEAFVAVEEIDDGVGPVFNEKACGNCHTEGAIGGAGIQIERRFGRFRNGRFDDLDNRGGSLRQLFTVGPFTGSNGETCNPPLEVEPREATVHNVGRLTTPLFGLGLVDALPDSLFDDIARNQPRDVRGTVNRVTILLPNPEDPSQREGGTRVGRFGWKAGVSNLTQFAADAYLNEMGISTQHCIGGRQNLAFATESAPNGIPQPPGCDDRGPGGEGVPAGVDDGVGECGAEDVIQDDVEEFAEFMTFLAPPPPGDISPRQAQSALDAARKAGCLDCHLSRTFRTPANPANGVPGNFAFRPFSDFLVHDMGALGDQIGNDGDSVARTRQMRTAPLWGLRFRTHFLHDGRATDLTDAIRQHGGQAASSASAFFNRLSGRERSDLLAGLRAL